MEEVRLRELRIVYGELAGIHVILLDFGDEIEVEPTELRIRQERCSSTIKSNMRK